MQDESDQGLTEAQLEAKYGRSEVHKTILNQHFEDGVSEEILSAHHGRSRQQIGRLIRASIAAGRVRKKVAGDRRSVVSSQPLSRVHKRVGMRFIKWRTIEQRIGVSEAAKKAGVSANRYHSIEAGIHNFTLLELHFICERMEWSLVDLIRGADLQEYMSAAS